MLRKDYAEIRIKAQEFENQTKARAALADLHWILCIWQGPITQELEKRVGYFEHIGDADTLRRTFQSIFERMHLPFYIITSYGETFDGGLFDEQ